MIGHTVSVELELQREVWHGLDIHSHKKLHSNSPCSGHKMIARDARETPSAAGVVHFWVGQILLNCNVFKT